MEEVGDVYGPVDLETLILVRTNIPPPSTDGPGATKGIPGVLPLGDDESGASRYPEIKFRASSSCIGSRPLVSQVIDSSSSDISTTANKVPARGGLPGETGSGEELIVESVPSGSDERPGFNAAVGADSLPVQGTVGELTAFFLILSRVLSQYEYGTPVDIVIVDNSGAVSIHGAGSAGVRFTKYCHI